MRWSYKTVHFSLKKGGLLGSAFLDETEVEVSLNEYGESGWELVSFMEVNDGLIAVFKQPFSQGLPSLDEAEYQEESTESSPEPEPVTGTEKRRADSSLISPLPEVPAEENRDNQKNGNDEANVGSIRII